MALLHLSGSNIHSGTLSCCYRNVHTFKQRAQSAAVKPPEEELVDLQNTRTGSSGL